MIIGLMIYFLNRKTVTDFPAPSEVTQQGVNGTPPTNSSSTTTDQATAPVDTTKTVIGTSVQNRAITAYHYGEGTNEVLFVAGVHGGYSWNTSLLAYGLMDYLKANPEMIPATVKITIIPTLNPDGLFKVVGVEGTFSSANVSKSTAVQVAGRFNANNVDLGRNFDCGWKSTGIWRTKEVLAGSSVFSEPESLALKSYVETHKLASAVVWYSAAGGVYASACDGDPSSATMKLTNVYAKASGYPAHESFDFYETSGDVVNWLASKKIPAISVLLTNHQDTEWSKNLAGVKATLNNFAK